MKRLLLLTAVLGLAACQDSIGPDPFARQHAITTKVVACANPAQFNLQVSWVDWQWQAIFLKDAAQVAKVTDASQTKSSGCVYALGDKARIELFPMGDITQYLDPAFVDVTISQ